MVAGLIWMSLTLDIPVMPLLTRWHRQYCPDSLTREEGKEKINQRHFDISGFSSQLQISGFINYRFMVCLSAKELKTMAKNLRWALEMQTTAAKSRNTLMMLDIVGFLFGQGDSRTGKNLGPCDEDDRKNW